MRVYVCVSWNWTVPISGYAKMPICKNPIHVCMKLTKSDTGNGSFFFHLRMAVNWLLCKALHVGFRSMSAIIFDPIVIWLEKNRLNVIKIIREIVYTVCHFCFFCSVSKTIKSFFASPREHLRVWNRIIYQIKQLVTKSIDFF